MFHDPRIEAVGVRKVTPGIKSQASSMAENFAACLNFPLHRLVLVRLLLRPRRCIFERSHARARYGWVSSHFNRHNSRINPLQRQYDEAFHCTALIVGLGSEESEREDPTDRLERR